MKNLSTVRQDYQLVNAKYKLDTSEIKFIMACITQIKKDDDDLQEYEIKVSDLESKLQAEQNETRLKQFAKKIMSKPLEVPTGDGWIIANWFADVEYKKGQAKFLVTFSSKLKPYLIDLQERYVMYNLRYILPLQSNYSIRIYQLLKEYEKLTKRYFLVDELMDILQVPNSLKRYDNFKRKVLKVAELEILDHTDIAFTFEEEKEGKRVHRLIFRISPNPKNNKEEPVQKSTALTFDFPEVKQTTYSKYWGRSVRASDGTIYENIIVVTPMSDGSLKLTFKDGQTVRADNENRLIAALI